MQLQHATVLFICASCVCLVGQSVRAKESGVEQKVNEVQDDSPTHSHGIYLEAGISALVFHPPGRKSSPVYNTDEDYYEPTQVPLPFSADDVTGMPRFALGCQLDRKHTPRALGEALQIEFSSNFFMSDEDGDGRLPPPHLTHGNTGFGYTDALLFGPNGVVQTTTFNEIGTPFPGNIGAPLASMRQTAEYEQLDLNLGVRTSYTLVDDRLSISPYIGFTRQTLGQELSLVISGVSHYNLLQPLQYRAKEELDTEAYGATVGLDLKVRILRRLSFVLGATVSPLWADTDMQLLYTGDYIDWPVGIDVIKRVTTGLKRSKDQFTYRAGAHAGLTYDVNRWFSIGVNGGVDYWNDVPTVKYPIYDPAEHVSPYDPGTSMRIPSIGHQSMFNWTGGVNFIFRFGGP